MVHLAMMRPSSQVQIRPLQFDQDILHDLRQFGPENDQAEYAMLKIDHLAIACTSLTEGVAALEQALSLTLSPGGEHPHMGTHNRLLSLGPDEYLEVIAINPDAPGPDQPRWFDLDNFNGAPRLTNWICGTTDLDAAVFSAPRGTGKPWDLARGDLAWRMAIPKDGKLPFQNGFPALIQWKGSAHPAPRLMDQGIRLRHLTIAHPQAAELTAALAGMISDPRIEIIQADAFAMSATLDTPGGTKTI
jgi:hypothetical protein